MVLGERRRERPVQPSLHYFISLLLNRLFYCNFYQLIVAAMKQVLWCLLLLGPAILAQEVSTADIAANEVAGNPYLFKDWSNGTVRFSSGREIKQFKLKFDVFKNQLLLQFEGSTFAAESKVQEFVLLPKSKTKDSLVFRKGFPASEKTNDHTFFQILFKDKVQLLRLFSRNIIEDRTLVTTGKHNKRLEEAETFYLFQNNQLIVLPARSNDLAAVFPEKKTELAAFIDTQNLRMRSAEDFLAVVKKYNELIP
jgi:hypothetical protein